ncbi:YciI family protein [Caulobacter soli]|uniref:YciI family protein n=1 Tax=Caulobacter soli TaxID=2708539 RepID=UPI0013EAEACB|nr:YciI family protein [Caulobacter soli]
MLYAILCYNFEDAIGAWTLAEDALVMARLGLVEAGLAAADRLGAVARLLPTTAAVTLRKGRSDGSREHLVIDGPFAETKEQLLGFYVVECGNLDAAIDVARDLAVANPDRGAYEIRPLAVYRPGDLTETRALIKGIGA